MVSSKCSVANIRGVTTLRTYYITFITGIKNPPDVSYTTLRTYHITFITGIKNPLMLATLHLELTTLIVLQRLCSKF
jgi:hypothetical protein